MTKDNSVIPYGQQWAETWDTFVRQSVNGTFLHSRRFLSYHGDRFDDRSLLIRSHKGTLLGVLPAAVDIKDNQIVNSHPGSTYGGLVQGGKLTGEDMHLAFAQILEHYRSQGFKSFIYKPVPHIYHRTPAMEDLYLMFRLGAQCIRRDLSSCIDLCNRLTPERRRIRGDRKAKRAGIHCALDAALLPQFWQILNKNLAIRHQTQPVHSIEEITTLIERFPQNIELATASHEGDVVAGALLFKTRNTTHCQYIGSSQPGRKHHALDMLFNFLIKRSQRAGTRFFNFGISTEQGGLALNQGLHRFKNGFGGGTIVHEFYRLECSDGD